MWVIRTVQGEGGGAGKRLKREETNPCLMAASEWVDGEGGSESIAHDGERLDVGEVGDGQVLSAGC